MDDQIEWGTSCSRMGAVDTVPIFRQLREMWKEKNPDKSLRVLAKVLDTRHQLVTTYATGKDSRRPPMWVVMRLCAILGMELRVHPDGVVLQKSKRSGLAAREQDLVYDWTQV